MAWVPIVLPFSVSNGGMKIKESPIAAAVALPNVTDWWTCEAAWLDLATGNVIVRWKNLKTGRTITVEQATSSKRGTIEQNVFVNNAGALFTPAAQTYYALSSAVDLSGSVGFGMFYKPMLSATVQGLAVALASSSSRLGINMASTAGGLQGFCGASSAGVGTIGGTCVMNQPNTFHLFKNNTNNSTTDRRLYLRTNGVDAVPVPHDNNVPSIPINLGCIQSGNSHFAGYIGDFFLTNGLFDTAGLAVMNALSMQATGVPF